MIKTLVSIDADLSSSIALRYTCLLAKARQVEIQTIHVQEPDSSGPGGLSMGSGWVRRTYEQELIDQSKKDISRLLTAESGFCPVLNQPIIIPGDRGQEILKELQKGKYDLFVEGAPLHSSGKDLVKHLRSHLYQHLDIPALFVQNLYPLKRITFMMESDREASTLFSSVAHLLNGNGLEIELAFTTAPGRPLPEEAMLNKMSEDYGWTVRAIYQVPKDMDVWKEHVKDCDLLTTRVERHKGHSNIQIEYLAQLSCPFLVFWK